MLKEIHVISSPIGNLGDMSFRSIEQLKSCDLIIVEEYKVGKKLLDLLKIDLSNKELVELNEHNQKRFSSELAQRLLSEKRNVALLCDAGTPAIADPGAKLLKELKSLRVRIRYYGGPSSIIGSLIATASLSETFYYAGFLPQIEKERLQVLKQIAYLKTTLVIMETPYRLKALLEGVKKVFSEKKTIRLCFALTTENEEVFEGSVKEALQKYQEKNRRPFVLLIENR